MVANVTELQRGKDSVQTKGLVIELVGVAGVGKTTLVRALCNQNQSGLVEEYVPQVWTLSTAPFYLKNIILILPILARLISNGGRFLSRRELAFMAILNGWDEILNRKAKHDGNIVIIDVGPIFIIGHLLLWGPQGLRSPNMDGWWKKIYEKYSHTVDMAFLLDTSDEIILSRIRTRPQEHFLKESSDQAAIHWTVKYRLLYEDIIDRLNSSGQKIQIVRIDSGMNSVDEIVKIVLQEVGQKSRDRNE